MQQIVDPFMPVTMRMPRPTVRPVQRVVPRARPAVISRRTIDGMIAQPVRRTFTAQPVLRPPARPLAQIIPNRLANSPVKAPPAAANQSVFENQFVPAAPQTEAVKAQSKAASKGRAKSIFRALELPAIILGSVIIGYFMQSLELGEIAIGAYAVAAIIFKVASRTTFTLALLSLFVIIAMVIAKPGSALASNFAVYTFLLLVVGTISLGREVRTENA